MKEIRLVLIGKTGVGKSETGNTILGEDRFKSDMSDQSVTITCRAEKSIRNDKQVLVVDTPALFDTHKSNEETHKQIMRCIGLSSPGPHAMVLVLSLASRFTKEEQEVLHELIRRFGEEINKYLIVVFTRGDDLKRRHKSIKDHLENAAVELQLLIKACKHRYVAFENSNPDRYHSSQVDELLKMIDAMVQENGGSHYSNEMYQKTEKMLQAKMERNRCKLELKKQKEVDKIKRFSSEKEKQRLLLETEQRYAALQSEEFQRQKVREKLEKDTGFLNSSWGVVKTTAAVVTSPVWLPLLGIVGIGVGVGVGIGMLVDSIKDSDSD